MSYFNSNNSDSKKMSKDPTLRIRMQLIEEKSSFTNYMDFYDRCIALIKSQFGITELDEKYLQMMDTLGEEIMGYPKFFI